MPSTNSSPKPSQNSNSSPKTSPNSNTNSSSQPSPNSTQQQKHAGPSITVVKSKPKTKLTIVKRYAYKLSDSLSFAQAVQGHKITDDKTMRFDSNFRRYELKKKQGSLTDKERITQSIRETLNKFTIDNIFSTFDAITQDSSFLTPTYIEQLGLLIFDQAKSHEAFAELYSKLLESILNTLDDKDLSNLHNLLYKVIIDNCINVFRTPILPNPESKDLHYFIGIFYGCLCKCKIISTSDAISQIEALFSLNNPLADVTAAKILVPCGSKIEFENPEKFAHDILPRLQHTSSNRSVEGPSRFFIADLLDAREANWDTSSLMSLIYSKKGADKDKAAFSDQPQTNNQPTPVISVQKNKFAFLADSSSDDEEEEVSQFNAMEMLHKWVHNEEVDDTYSQENIEELIDVIVTSTHKQIEKCSGLIDELEKCGKFDHDETVNALAATAEKYHGNYDFPSATRFTAFFLSLLVNGGKCVIEDYVKVIQKPSLECAIAFLVNLNDDALDAISNNEFWLNLQWVPQEKSFINVINAVETGIRDKGLAGEESTDEMYRLFAYIPLLDNINAVFDILDVEDLVVEDAVKSIMEETPSEILEMPKFAIGVAQVVMNVISDGHVMVEILKPFKKFENEVLVALENEAKKTMSEEQIANIISELGKQANFNVESFKAMDLGPTHAKIAEKIQ